MARVQGGSGGGGLKEGRPSDAAIEQAYAHVVADTQLAEDAKKAAQEYRDALAQASGRICAGYYSAELPLLDAGFRCVVVHISSPPQQSNSLFRTNAYYSDAPL